MAEGRGVQAASDDAGVVKKAMVDRDGTAGRSDGDGPSRRRRFVEFTVTLRGLAGATSRRKDTVNRRVGWNRQRTRWKQRLERCVDRRRATARRDGTAGSRERVGGQAATGGAGVETRLAGRGGMAGDSDRGSLWGLMRPRTRSAGACERRGAMGEKARDVGVTAGAVGGWMRMAIHTGVFGRSE